MVRSAEHTKPHHSPVTTIVTTSHLGALRPQLVVKLPKRCQGQLLRFADQSCLFFSAPGRRMAGRPVLPLDGSDLSACEVEPEAQCHLSGNPDLVTRRC